MLYKIYVFLYLNEPTFFCALTYMYLERERNLHVPGLIKGISVVRVSSHGSADWAVGEVKWLAGGIGRIPGG